MVLAAAERAERTENGMQEQDRVALIREVRETVTQTRAALARLEALADALDAQQVKPARGACPFDDIVGEWNRRCAVAGMIRRNSPGELREAISIAWTLYPHLDLWRAAFDACAKNEHWRGANGWKGNLESFLRKTHRQRFFDEASGAKPEAPSLFSGGTRGTDDPEARIEEEIDALLADPARTLPSGYDGPDPRPLRGKDMQGFAAAYERLRGWMRTDWRFS